MRLGGHVGQASMEYTLQGNLGQDPEGFDWLGTSWSHRTEGKMETMPCGGLRFGLINRPMIEMSLSVMRISLFPLPIWRERDNELLVLEFGGKPRRVAYSCDIFTRVFCSMSVVRYFLYREIVISGE